MIPLGALSAILQVIASSFETIMIYLVTFLAVLICLVLAECIFERGDVVCAYTVKSNSADRDGISGCIEGDDHVASVVRHTY